LSSFQEEDAANLTKLNDLLEGIAKLKDDTSATLNPALELWKGGICKQISAVLPSHALKELTGDASGLEQTWCLKVLSLLMTRCNL
jgi:hypothetical protein